MLVLRRKSGETIIISDVIKVHILAVEGERVKVGIEAPPQVIIVREELLTGFDGPSASSLPSFNPNHRFDSLEEDS